MIPENLYQTYLKQLLSGSREQCFQIVKQVLDTEIQVRDLYLDLFHRSMYEVGALWESNKISVATEHLATSITESLLTLAYPRIFAAEHKNRQAVIACVANEFHQLGGRMVADIFELKGWHGYFLGANTPDPELFKILEEKKPDLLGLSLSVFFNMDKLLLLLEKLKIHWPDLPVLVGGQAFRWGGSAIIEDFPGVRYVPGLKELEDLIESQ